MHQNHPYNLQHMHQQHMQQQQLHQQQLHQQRHQHQWYPHVNQQGAQGHPHMPPMNMQPQNMQRQISIEDAIQIAREQMPGQVVKAELERKGGQLIYEVDVISAEGVKYEVKINANTGEVIEVELD
ncbi:MAG TPA: PepSY domain-containing protein [Candidatus Dormibacteraeota bacterium]|nr:PepSY domain-containing protein [Candidatus Dormibacteraeota bacterium]